MAIATFWRAKGSYRREVWNSAGAPDTRAQESGVPSHKVRGDENGTAFFNWQWRKDGPCHALLRLTKSTTISGLASRPAEA